MMVHGLERLQRLNWVFFCGIDNVFMGCVECTMFSKLSITTLYCYNRSLPLLS